MGKREIQGNQDDTQQMEHLVKYKNQALVPTYSFQGKFYRIDQKMGPNQGQENREVAKDKDQGEGKGIQQAMEQYEGKGISLFLCHPIRLEIEVPEKVKPHIGNKQVVQNH
jgi:hypothetical protein